MFTVELQFEKATKNKVRMQHPDFGTIYVPNEVYAELGNPERLKVTLEPAHVAAPVALAA
jgi:hypothetical protein